MHKNHSSGFTLIELLVVIGIIGILSAVVLASLNTARFKGNDAAIQSDLSTVQTQAEIYYGGTGNNSYGTAGNSCSSAVFSDATIVKAIAGAQAANGGTALTCNNSTTAYAISSKMSADPTRYWCVDSTGGTSKSTTALGTNTVCPASN
jgi:prepilin-type N-terminal cleavage/methylation domain-containing protein